MPSDYNDTGIATGAIANIQNGADSVPIKSWNVNIDPNLTWKSAVKCIQDGINLWNESWETGAISETTGANTVNNSKIRPTGLIAVKPSTSFYIVCPQLIQILFYRKDETYIGIGSGYGSSRVFTTDAETYFIRFNVANAYGNTYNNDISVNYPSTDTSYHAHTTQIVNTVSLGRTIYGGSVDVVAGTGKEEYIKVTFDGSDDEGWTKTNAGPYYTTITGYYKKQGFINGICDSFTMVAEVGLASNMTTDLSCSFYFGNDQNRFYIRYDAMADAAALKTWLSQNPVTIVYKVATSTPFAFDPITPTPETALGVNNFYGDTGDSEVTYYKSGYGYTSVTVNQKDSSDTLIDTKTIKFHRIIYEGSVDVIRGIGTISVGESGTEYDPPESFNFSPISMSTIEGEQTLYSDEGNSAITYRKGVE